MSRPETKSVLAMAKPFFFGRRHQFTDKSETLSARHLALLEEEAHTLSPFIITLYTGMFQHFCTFRHFYEHGTQRESSFLTTYDTTLGLMAVAIFASSQTCPEPSEDFSFYF